MESEQKKIHEGLYSLANPEKAVVQQRFFKTEKGGYAEGDQFLGVAVPVIRKLAKAYRGLSYDVISECLQSKYNEERLLGLVILVERFRKARETTEKENIYNFYIKHLDRANNWNLVDLSAPGIVGEYLIDKDREVLRIWAKSENLWLRRISIVATYSFIRRKEFKDTIEISEVLLNDKESLIHKAVGWMLREMGKRNKEPLVGFLKKYGKTMPRTMLRYAIEKFDQKEREQYMKKV